MVSLQTFLQFAKAIVTCSIADAENFGYPSNTINTFSYFGPWHPCPPELFKVIHVTVYLDDASVSGFESTSFPFLWYFSGLELPSKVWDKSAMVLIFNIGGTW
jgi:hypothetical protein